MMAVVKNYVGKGLMRVVKIEDRKRRMRTEDQQNFVVSLKGAIH